MSDFDIMKEVSLSEAERRTILSSVAHVADYALCGNRVRISSNRPDPIESFTRMYKISQIEAAPDSNADLNLVCSYGEDDRGENVTILAGGKVYRIWDREVLAFIYSALAYLVFKHIRSHYLVHAGCVCRDGKAIAISGVSGMGKSTLTSYLVSRGMGFLSDEVAAIDRKTGLVHPFPLQIGIRPGIGEDLVTDLPAFDMKVDHDPKKLIDARHLRGGLITEPVPLHAVVFLSSNPRAKVSTPAKFDGTIKVFFLGLTPEFEAELLERTASTVMDRDNSNPYLPALLLQVGRPETFLETLYEVCEKHSVPLGGLLYEDYEERDFSKSPQLIKLPAAAGMIELAKKIPSTQKGELISQEFGGKMALFMQELSSLSAHVDYYKMSPGRLHEMIDLVENLP
ncbi:MAG: hypothetical protein KJ626_10365 [Verrucomicrobia bacterium]|nr:hypothetical protein [Verrucomicrobiota bacterium]